jgi:hypothetical protein
MLRIDPERMRGVAQAEFDVAELRHLRPVAMLFQAGYLTIKDYAPLTGLYTLGVPDEEVRRYLTNARSGSSVSRSTRRPAASSTAPQCPSGS